MDVERAYKIARFWSDILNITKRIEVLFFSIKPATRKEPLGYVLESSHIQIYLRKFTEIEVPEIIEDLVYHGIILHELFHIKCPDKSEDEIIKITGEHLGGAYCFKTKCIFCDEVLPSPLELRRHLEDMHGARP